MSQRSMFFNIRPVAWMMLALWSVTSMGASPQVIRRVVGDIQYFSGREADPDFHSLDLYLPEGESQPAADLLCPRGRLENWRQVPAGASGFH